MFNSNNTPFTMPVAPAGSGFGGFGDGGAWIWFILVLVIFGWGNGGWGANGSQGAANNYVLASDFATLQRQMSDGFGSVERKGDNIINGLSNGFYTENTTLLNGFAGVNQSIATNGYETRSAIQNAQVTDMQNFNALQSQLAQCCCDNKTAIADLKYSGAMNASAIQTAMDKDFCQTNFNSQQNTRDIIENANNNTKSILDFLVNDKISTLQAENQNLRLAASQANQNEYLISQLKTPCPIPSYTVPNPYCNCNSGCGC